MIKSLWILLTDNVFFIWAKVSANFLECYLYSPQGVTPKADGLGFFQLFPNRCIGITLKKYPVSWGILHAPVICLPKRTQVSIFREGYKRPPRMILSAVSQSRSQKRCLSSQESFSASSFFLHWLSLPLQALLRKGASSGWNLLNLI